MVKKGMANHLIDLTLLFDFLQNHPYPSCVWIAYSGGLDSHVLLHSLSQIRCQLPPLRAIHIHHGLHTEADAWAEHCQQHCDSLDIPLKIIHITVPQLPRTSLEATARTWRYSTIAKQLTAEDLVVTAHHADDQTETLLLQLLRGSGPAGLAAMPMFTQLNPGWLVRPLLAYSRSELHDYAQHHHLHWIEDPSNFDSRHTRNFLRHHIIPLLKSRWPALTSTLNRVAHHQAEAQHLLELLAQQDLQHSPSSTPPETSPHQIWEWGLQKNQKQKLSLPISQLTQLSSPQQTNVLRYWLKQQHLPLPATVQLQQILASLCLAGTDRQPLIQWAGAEIRRHANHLWILPPLPPVPTSQKLPWHCPAPLPLPLGQLVSHPGHGLKCTEKYSLQVRFRQGGEHFYWRGHQRSVKKLLQEFQVPNWLRPFMPLIYQAETLIALPGIGVHPQWESVEGWDLRWQLDIPIREP